MMTAASDLNAGPTVSAGAQRWSDAGAWIRPLLLLAALWAVWEYPDGAFPVAISGAVVGTTALADPGGDIENWPLVIDDDPGDLDTESS
jgi:hypothetical protein